MNEDPLLCDDSVNKNENFYTDTDSLPGKYFSFFLSIFTKYWIN